MGDNSLLSLVDRWVAPLEDGMPAHRTYHGVLSALIRDAILPLVAVPQTEDEVAIGGRVEVPFADAVISLLLGGNVE